LPGGIAQAAQFGGDWFEVSTPFVVRDGQRVLAHAGVVAVDLRIDCAPRRLAAVHAVCVDREHRGRGLGRTVLEQALAYVDQQGFDTCILWSDLADLYGRFGFEPCRESVFVGKAPRAAGLPGQGLDLDNEADLSRLRSLLARRAPVSGVAAAADNGWHFLIDLGLWSAAQTILWWLDDADALVVAELKGNGLHLYDVVATRLPPLERIVAAIPGTAERLVCYFTPDLIAPKLDPAPHPLPDLLMVRGAPFVDPTTTPFGLSPLVRT
jgi:predicted GNAT family acetyltransferase